MLVIKMDNETNIFILLLSIAGWVLLTLILLIIFLPPIHLTQETADEICKQLTDNEIAVAQKNSYKTLTCEIPSFDSTQNIIIKSNSERN